MGRCRVVQPEVVRLPLSDGDYLDVKKELNAGEYFDLITALGERKPFSKIVQYVVGWSLTGLAGTPIPYALEMDEHARRDTVRALDKPTLRELIAAVDKHEAAEEAAHAAKKKTGGGAPASSPTSASATP